MVCAANVASLDWPTNLPERVDLPVKPGVFVSMLAHLYSQQSTRTPDE